MPTLLVSEGPETVQLEVLLTPTPSSFTQWCTSAPYHVYLSDMGNGYGFDYDYAHHIVINWSSKVFCSVSLRTGEGFSQCACTATLGTSVGGLQDPTQSVPMTEPAVSIWCQHLYSML